jgi:uncharacterized protein (TIGR01777 family)
MNILITGSTGMIGKNLVQLLRSQGHVVYSLTSDVKKQSQAEKVFYWSYSESIFPKELDIIPDTVIHLAGANIGNRRWTDAYKKEIIESRVNSSSFLLNALAERNMLPKRYITASGTDYYPNPGNKFYAEDDAPGNQFAAKVCKQWEGVALLWKEKGVNVSIIRTPAVLANGAGLLNAFMQTAFLRVIPTTGSANNALSWVHIDDICRIYLEAVNDKLDGVWNACAPEPTTFGHFVKAIDQALEKKSWHPNVPCFALKLALGERAALPCSNQNVSSKKLLSTEFRFLYPDIKTALNELLSH